MATASAPKTLQQAILFFADYENCHKAVASIRWPDGVVGVPALRFEQGHLSGECRAVWKCYEKHPQGQVLAEGRDHLRGFALRPREVAARALAARQLQERHLQLGTARALGVTQKTAWFMLSRLRLALQSETGGKLGGDVEVDETFIGGRARNMHTPSASDRHHSGHVDGWQGRRHGPAGPARRRASKSASQVVRPQQASAPDPRPRARRGRLHSTPMRCSPTQGDREYSTTSSTTPRAYVDGQVHTNGMENFWSLLKRALNGTYVSVEPFHLFRYLDEQAFRFNNRHRTDAARFALPSRASSASASLMLRSPARSCRKRAEKAKPQLTTR